MPTGLFSQIALIVLSLGIIFTYIKPVLGEIGTLQDNITVYQTERQKVTNVNQKLDRIVSAVSAISADDQRRLLTYIPDQVDAVAVPRDLNSIAQTAGVILSQIKYEGPQESSTASGFVDPSLLPVTSSFMDFKPEAHVFTFEFEASYEQVKVVLAAIEKNAYPLEVHEMTVEKTEGGFLSVNMKLVTFDRLPPPVAALDQVPQITS